MKLAQSLLELSKNFQPEWKLDQLESMFKLEDLPQGVCFFKWNIPLYYQV